MKRILLNVLLVCLVMVFMVACDSNKKNETSNTPVNANDLSTLKGNYEVQAFFNNTVLASVGMQDITFTYNCNELKNIDSSTECDPAQDVSLASQAVISGTSATDMVLETKVQMAGGSFGTLLSNPAFADMVKSNAYNYTRYGVAVAGITPPDVTLPANVKVLASATGVSGRNMNSTTSDSAAGISFLILDDGRMIVSSSMTVSGMPTETIVILKKINDGTPAVDANALVKPNMAGFDASGFASDLISGTYTVSFFGTQVTNPKMVANGTDFPVGSLMYISNDCVKAKVLYPDIIGVEDGSGTAFNQCDPDSGQTTLQKGVVAVEVKDGKIHVTSKMEMKGGSVDLSAPDKYQFTTYHPINFNGEANVSGTGVKGFNFDQAGNAPSATETDFATSPFTIVLDGAGNIDIAMTLIGKQANVFGMAIILDAVTRVQATRVGPYAPLENRVETDLTTVTP